MEKQRKKVGREIPWVFILEEKAPWKWMVLCWQSVAASTGCEKRPVEVSNFSEAARGSYLEEGDWKVWVG